MGGPHGPPIVVLCARSVTCHPSSKLRSTWSATSRPRDCGSDSGVAWDGSWRWVGVEPPADESSTGAGVTAVIAVIGALAVLVALGWILRRLPFPLWFVPGVAALLVISGRFRDSEGWVKVGLALAGLALPSYLVVARYFSDRSPSEPELLRRRLAVMTLAVFAVIGLVWMVGGIDHVTPFTLDTVGAATGSDATVFHVDVELPPGASLVDVDAVGGRIKVLTPELYRPGRYRLSLWEAPTANDIAIEVSWRIPLWRDPGEVDISIAAASTESG